VPAQPSSASPYSAPPTWQPGQRRVYADGYSAPPPNVSANSKHLVVALRMLISKLCIHSPPPFSLSQGPLSCISLSLSMHECHVGFRAC
jgi:hypothetical protein